MLDNNIYYTLKGIYGVKMYNYINKECNILFTQQLNTLMSNEMIEELKVFYSNLGENSKTNLKIKIYRKCKSIESNEIFMIWCDISLNKFISDFGV
jgi:hypothetical protein